MCCHRHIVALAEASCTCRARDLRIAWQVCFIAKAHSSAAKHASLVSSCDLSRKRLMCELSNYMNDQLGHLVESGMQHRLVDVPIRQRGGMWAQAQINRDSQLQQEIRVVVAWRNSVALRFGLCLRSAPSVDVWHGLTKDPVPRASRLPRSTVRRERLVLRGGMFVPRSGHCRLCPAVTWHTVRCDASLCHRIVLRRQGRDLLRHHGRRLPP